MCNVGGVSLSARESSGWLTFALLAGVSFAGRQVSGHQRLLFPAFLCAGDPHAQTVPAEGSARRHADQQNVAPAGQGGFHDADADDWIELLLQGHASPVSVELSREETEAVVGVCAQRRLLMSTC